MRILISWLRDFVTFDADVQELADTLTMRGFEVSAIEPPPQGTGTADPDAVLDLEITTNRPDCLSVFGIAREVSTIYDTPLRSPRLNGSTSGPPVDPDVSVTLEDADSCPRYAASVAAVTVGPSPGWLAARLTAAGVRPINNVVDVTNYVMFELGHPMHAFDLDRLGGPALRIRCADPGEKIQTIDGQEHALRNDMLVIADAERAQAVAGVMGGADSEVSGATRRVVVESAYFKPTSIRRTSRELALSTDASYRFERGTDIEAPIVAMRRLHTLFAELGIGQPQGPVIDRYPHPATPQTVELRHDRVARILGVGVDAVFVETTLERLGFTVQPTDSQEGSLCWRITVPSHRVDVSREVDLIEEIARHHGYDRLPSTFPALHRPPAPLGGWLRRHQLLRRVLTASGCSEAITYSFIERAAAEPFVRSVSDVVRIANPLSEKFAVMRPCLLPGLVDSVVRNRRREHRDVRLFEIGKRFSADGGETAGAAVAMTGAGVPEHWSANDRATDVFDIKGIVERVCDALGVTPIFEPIKRPFLEPGRAATVRAEPLKHQGIELGYLGQLAPAVATARGFPGTGDEIYVAELDLGVLDRVAADRDRLHAEPVPRHPSIVRDLAIVVDGTLPASSVRDTIRSAAPDTLVSVREFDRYEGKGIPDGCVSLAFRLTFRVKQRTLTDAEVQETIDAIVAALEQQHDATLR